MPTRLHQLTELLAALAARLFSRARRTVRPKHYPSKCPARCRFEQLESREVFNATYHGGALLTHVEAQPVFLGTAWNSGTLSNEAASVDSFVQYLVKSPYMDLMTDAGYNVGQGTATAGARVNATFTGTTVTDANIRSTLQLMISQSLVGQPTKDKLYLIYTPSGIAVNNNGATSITTFLGYHGAFAGTDKSGVPFDIHYAVMPHPGAPNVTSASQGFTGLAEVQLLTLDGNAGGTLTPALNGVSATTGITRTDEVQTLTLGGTASGVVTLSFNGVQAATPLVPKGEIQRLDLGGTDGGTVRLSYNGVIGTESTALTFHPGVSPTKADVETHLKSIPALADQNSVPVVNVTGNDGGPFTITFVGALNGANVSQIGTSATVDTTAAVTTVTEGSISAPEIQTALELIPALAGNVRVTPGNSSKEFNITFIGSLSGKNIDDGALTAAATVNTTATIAKSTDGSSPTAALVQASLNTITGLTGNVTVTGNAGGPFTITVRNAGNIGNLDVSHVTGGLTAAVTPVGDGGATADLDQLMAVTSHELAEAVTDPDVNYKTLGWFDDAFGVEIGDITGASTNTVRMGTHGFLTQDLFNSQHTVTAPDTTSVVLTTSPTLATPKALSLTRAEVSWTQVAGATGYRILLVNSDSSTSLLARVPAMSNGSPVTSTVLNGLHPLVSQKIRVEAYNANETNNSHSADVTFSMPLPTLAAPTGVSVVKNPVAPQTSVVITWTGNGGAAGYRILLINGSRRTIVATAGETATSATINGLAAGATLTFRVEAFRGQQVADSVAKQVTLAKASLAAPDLTIAAVNGNTSVVQLTWTAVPTAQGYRIYRLSGSTRILVKTLGASATSMKISGFPAGTSFQVEAFRGTLKAASKWKHV